MKMKLTLKLVSGLLLGVAAWLPLPASAQMNYQGRLTDSSGNPRPDGQYTLTFNLYDAASAGTKVWGPFLCDGVPGAGHASKADLVNGRFNVVLGTLDTGNRSLAASFAGGAPRFLGITVGVGGTEIAPRQQLLAAPEALHALRADFATVAAAVGNGGSSVISILDNKVGIGLPTPGAPLDVLGQMQVGANGTIQSIGSKNSFRGMIETSYGTPSDRYGISQGPSGELAIYTSGSYPFSSIQFGQATGADSFSPQMTIDHAGKVGIGTSNPGGNLEVKGAFWTTPLLKLNQDVGSWGSVEAFNNFRYISTAFPGVLADGPFRQFNVGGGGVSIGYPNVPTYGSADALYVNGNVGIGTTTPGDRLTVNGIVQGTGFRCRQAQNNPPEPHVFNFNWQGTYIDCFIDSSFVGGIQFLSDRRLKENIEPLQASALDRVKALRPVSFQYKNIPDSIFAGSPDLQEGFIADELQTVIPSAVNGAKDGLTKDGKIRPQALNLAPIISVLTKAAQELAGQVETQKSELTDLRAELSKLRSEKASLAQTVNDIQARFLRLEQVMNKAPARDAKDAGASADVK